MIKLLITNARYPVIDDLERPISEGAGFELELAQCRTPEQAIQAGQGCP